jgi:sulfite dehydrogenase (cytochrome) subunit A
MSKNHEPAGMDSSRRSFFGKTAAMAGLGLLGSTPVAAAAARTVELPMANGTRELALYPEKRELIVMTARPVQLETPFEVFNDGAYTPNDAFFVRWHLAGVPTAVDADDFRVQVRGRVKQALTLSIAELQGGFEAVEISAVCQCAGNSRGFFNPRVPGGEWGNGAMGNALWKGVRLRDVLQKAGVETDAVQVRFNGADVPVLAATPDFIKAVDLGVALRDDVILAYRMNGAPLPLLNGYPLRLVVPGWFGTYWVKMLNDIEVISQVDENFWMKPGYRIPDDPCACMEPGQKGVNMVPITRMPVRSFITSLADGARLKGGHDHEVKGIAFDGGYGIARVLFSADGGKNWSQAELGADHGKYAFRQWSARFAPKTGRQYVLACLAVNNIGESQRFTPRWNPAGYMRNVVETYRVSAV